MAKKARKKAKPAKTSKSKRKPVKAKVTKKAKSVKKTKKRAPVKAAKVKRAAVKAKKPAKKAKRAKTKDVIGEGNYTASRNFRKKETSFVKKNRKKIPAMGKAAEVALDGPEGAELRRAEAETGARGQD